MTNIKEEFYKAAIADYNKGTDVSYFELILKELEEQELYNECAGLKKAMDEIDMIESKKC
jgi:hypothetical protein